MIRKSLVAAIFAVSQASAFFRLENFWEQLQTNDVTPNPGAIQVLFNVPSTSSFMKYISLFAPSQALIGKVIDLNLDWHSKLGEISLKSANITAAQIADASLTFVNDTDRLKLEITGADLTLDLDGSVKTALGIHVDLANLTITNATISIEAETQSDDEVHWKLAVDPYFNVQDIELMCTKKMWQKLIDDIKPEFMDLVHYLLNFGEGVGLGLVDALNYELAHQTEDTFVFDLNLMNMTLPFNLTMARYPQFSHEKQEIQLNIAGLFGGSDVAAGVPPATVWADFVGQQQREQIWLHQSLIDSFLYSLKKEWTSADKGFMTQLYQLVPEVFRHYGATVECSASLSLPMQEASPIKIDATKGIIIGDETTWLDVDLKLFCKNNDTVPEPELALDMDLGVALTVNATWDNFEYWIALNDARGVHADVTSPAMKLNYHDWIAEITALLKATTTEFNLGHATPVDLKAKYPLINMVAGLFRSTLLSPFVTDEFLLAGFKMITDPADPMADPTAPTFLQ